MDRDENLMSNVLALVDVFDRGNSDRSRLLSAYLRGSIPCALRLSMIRDGGVYESGVDAKIHALFSSVGKEDSYMEMLTRLRQELKLDAATGILGIGCCLCPHRDDCFIGRGKNVSISSIMSASPQSGYPRIVVGEIASSLAKLKLDF